MSIISITQFNHAVNPFFDFIRKKMVAAHPLQFRAIVANSLQF